MREAYFLIQLNDEICDAFDLLRECSMDRQKMIRVARKFAVHEFDQKTMVDKYLEVIHHSIGVFWFR